MQNQNLSELSHALLAKGVSLKTVTLVLSSCFGDPCIIIKLQGDMPIIDHAQTALSVFSVIGWNTFGGKPVFIEVCSASEPNSSSEVESMMNSLDKTGLVGTGHRLSIILKNSDLIPSAHRSKIKAVLLQGVEKVARRFFIALAFNTPLLTHAVVATSIIDVLGGNEFEGVPVHIITR